MRLIDADAVEEFIRPRARQLADKIGWSDLYLIGFTDALECIKSAPTVDAEPVVHARWVHEQRYGDSGGWVWRCSACRHEAISPIISALKRCHHCGAKMDAPGGDADA